MTCVCVWRKPPRANSQRHNIKRAEGSDKNNNNMPGRYRGKACTLRRLRCQHALSLLDQIGRHRPATAQDARRTLMHPAVTDNMASWVENFPCLIACVHTSRCVGNGSQSKRTHTKLQPSSVEPKAYSRPTRNPTFCTRVKTHHPYTHARKRSPLRNFSA